MVSYDPLKLWVGFSTQCITIREVPLKVSAACWNQKVTVITLQQDLDASFFHVPHLKKSSTDCFEMSISMVLCTAAKCILSISLVYFSVKHSETLFSQSVQSYSLSSVYRHLIA